MFFVKLVLLSFAVVFSASNIVTITEKTGLAQTNYPVQMGRPFLPGEIPQYPQALINGQPVTTQADVKIRYSDNSARHAILCFLIPNLPANGSVAITFQNQSSGNNQGFLDKTGMLGTGYNFEAIMELVNGAATRTCSARTMLTADAFTYWLKGSVATSIIIADHSAARAFDVGFDTNRRIRPVFLATFWSGINKVRVRFIGENSNTEAYQDQSYSVTLKTGASSPSIVYTQTTFTHSAATRWSKEFWIGSAPSTVDINYNLCWLAKTRFIPNYDTTKMVPASAVTSAYANWQSAPKKFFESGNWMPSMGTAGGRDDIGPYPGLTVLWLYTGDSRMSEVCLGNADLAGAWPMCIREGNPTKKLFRNDTLSGLGRVLSPSTRPTFTVLDLTWGATNVEDRIVPKGTYSSSGWNPDNSHQPDAYSVPYMLTGDFWYLEQLWFWASWSTVITGAPWAYWGRGPTGAEGGIHDQVRGDAWLLRSRTQTAFLSPDGTPEKSFFNSLINDLLAMWEGENNVTGTAFEGNTMWSWGHTVGVQKYGTLGPSPLRFWERNPGLKEAPVDTNVASEGTSPWMEWLLIWAMGRAKELGYPTGSLLSWIAPNLTGQLTDPGYNPYLVGSYRVPVIRRSDGQWFDSWAAVKSGLVASEQDLTRFPDGSYYPDCADCYPFMAMAAAAAVAGESNGQAAWNWISEKTLGQSSLNSSPKWAIVPRTDTLIIAVESASMPGRALRLTAFPNPFNPEVTLNLATTDYRYENGFSLKVYEMSGRMVADLSSWVKEGRVVWNAASVSSGVYVVKFTAGRQMMTKQVILLK